MAATCAPSLPNAKDLSVSVQPAVEIRPDVYPPAMVRLTRLQMPGSSMPLRGLSTLNRRREPLARPTELTLS